MSGSALVGAFYRIASCGISWPSMALTDKREHRRIPVDLWIEVERDGELYFQRAANLSVGGAYFEKTIPLPVGTSVQLKFTLPSDAHEIRCQGEIVSAKDLGMGVQFLGMKETDRARIESLIDRHLGK